MTGDEYVELVLAKYAVATGPTSSAMVAANSIAPTLRTWAGVHLSELTVAGSYAKGTAVAGRTDVDLFISLRSETPGTLKELYDSLYLKAVGQAWFPRKQNVSIGITIGGVKIDLVPGRIQPGYQNWHSLWKNKANTWTQTNVALQTGTVRDSGRTREIRAIKIWRQNHGLDFPSFYLELTVLDALRLYGSSLAPNIQTVLKYLSESFVGASVIDPGNTNNTVSDDLTAAEQRTIATQAKRSHADPWDQTLW